MEWSQDKILLFIELYHNTPILWDPQDPQHYNKLKKQDAWQKLADELKTTTEDAKRKMTSLLASLRREKAKISKSKSTGKGAEEVYNSTWFAFKPLMFVLDRNKPRLTTDTIDNDNEMEEEENAVEEVGATTNVRVTDERARNAKVSKDDASRPPRNKKAKSSAEEMMTSAYSILKKAAQKPETPMRPAMDECESFGVFVSNKLKNYSRSTRNIVQHKFSNILFEADQGRYDSVDRYEYDYGQSHSMRSNSSTSTYPATPSPSPQTSLQTLGGNEYAISHQPPPYISTPNILSPSTSSQHAGIQEEPPQESQEFVDDFSDLIS